MQQVWYVFLYLFIRINLFINLFPSGWGPDLSSFHPVTGQPSSGPPSAGSGLGSILLCTGTHTQRKEAAGKLNSQAANRGGERKKTAHKLLLHGVKAVRVIQSHQQPTVLYYLNWTTPRWYSGAPTCLLKWCILQDCALAVWTWFDLHPFGPVYKKKEHEVCCGGVVVLPGSREDAR